MDPETKKFMEESLVLAKQNNIMLTKLVQAQQRATIFKYVYWGAIIISTIAVYYVMKPLLGNLLNIYTGGDTSISGSSSQENNQKQMEDLIKSLQK